MKLTEITAATALPIAQQAAAEICQTPIDTPASLAALRLLCELAAADDEALARAGATGIFPALVERLNDSFEPQACDRYDEVFTQIIEHFRRLPAAREFDAALCHFGLRDEADLQARKQRIRQNQPIKTANIKKILLLSRVTIGADVAVTGVLLAALQQRFPQAECVWLGSSKLGELWGGDANVRVRELSYERGGTVLARLNSWLGVSAAVADELHGLANDEWLVVDPDSRLTQLGLLPVVPADHHYVFFESRRYQAESPWPLARLAALWCNERFDTPVETFPQVALPAAHRALGHAAAEYLRRAGHQRVVSLSLGVGGNPAKRISETFEANLLKELVKGAALVLDKGGAPAEREQIDQLLAPLQAAGATVLELNAENAPERLAAVTAPASIITWDGSIGAFAGLIAASDQYIGYDSAGQHIAAALGVPVLTLFVNANTPRFAARWRPFGKGPVEIVSVNANEPPDERELLQLALAGLRRLQQ